MIEFNPLKSPCVECGLWVGKKHPCIRPQEKNLKTGGIVLIGEGPGNEEDISGTAFVGPAGKIIREALDRLGVTNYTFINAVCCRPTKGISNRPPTQRELDLCKSFLCESLTTLEPGLILCLGLIAAKSLGLTGKMRDLRNREWSINRHTWLQNAPQELVREMQTDGERALGKESSPGEDIELGNWGVPVYVTYHPAASMRPGQKHLAQVMEEDIRLYLTKGSLRDPLIYTEPEPTRRPHLSSEYHIFEEKSMSDNQAPKWVEMGKMVHFSWGPNNMQGIYEEAPTVRKPDIDKQEEVCDNTIRECREEERNGLADTRDLRWSSTRSGIPNLVQILVVDIETDGFLKDKDPFHFGDKGREIWVIGTDKGNVDEYVS